MTKIPDLASLVKRLEQEHGTPIEITVRIPGYDKKIYGSLDKRTCEIIPLPTNDERLKQDLDMLKGKYLSLNAIEENLRPLSFLHGGSIEILPKQIREPVLEMFKRHIPEDEENYYYVSWASIGDPNETPCYRPKLYQEIIDLVKKEKIPFIFNELCVSTNGIYIGEDITPRSKKVANIKLSLLNGQK